MLLGIDYGTTRTVVAVADRGNYPVVSFHNEGGDTQEWYPSLIAARDGELLFGLDAAARQGEPGWQMARSFKRELATLGPESKITLGNRSITAIELLTGFLARLRRDLAERSNLR
ncbi:MAG TPA: Hsp70 family protein, partial [Blastocatellia bacterium]|nr:Hsp70 family protein [Blastocatellia bacterium]